MSNGTYLIVSYFTVGLAAVATALLVVHLLRHGFSGIIAKAPNKPFGALLKRLFTWGVVLPALIGFFSVSYSCDKRYDEIIADRAYILQKSQEQITQYSFYINMAMLFWALLAIGVLVMREKQK